LQRGPNLSLQSACPCLANPSSPTEHRAIADLHPRFIRDPIAAFLMLQVGLLACLSQCVEVKGQSGMRLWRELQGEALVSLAICCHSTRLPRMEGCNDRLMVQMMNQGCPECHLPKMLDIVLRYQNVVRLGLMPSTHPLLAPCPSFHSSLHPALSKSEFTRCVNKVYFIDKVSNCLFTIITWVLKVDIKVTQDNWNAVGRAQVPGRPKIIHPQRIMGGMYIPIT